jgi:hypothetical protein
MELEFIQVLGKAGTGQVRPRHHTPDEVVSFGKLEQPSGLVKRAMRLNHNRLVHTLATEKRS